MRVHRELQAVLTWFIMGQEFQGQSNDCMMQHNAQQLLAPIAKTPSFRAQYCVAPSALHCDGERDGVL